MAKLRRQHFSGQVCQVIVGLFLLLNRSILQLHNLSVDTCNSVDRTRHHTPYILTTGRSHTAAHLRYAKYVGLFLLLNRSLLPL